MSARHVHTRPRHRRFVLGAAVLALAAVGFSPAASAEPGPPDSLLAEGAGLAAGDLGTLTEEAAKAQQEFIAASTAYEAAQREADGARVLAEQRQKDAEAAALRAAALKKDIGQWAAGIYRNGGGIETDPAMQVILSNPKSAEDALAGFGYISSVTTTKDNRATAAVRAQELAQRLAKEAVELKAQAEAKAAEAAALLAAMQEKAAKITAELNARMSVYGDSDLTPEQRALNEAAARQWRQYLTDLAAAKVVPPAASALTDPARLPAGLVAVQDGAGQPVPGVARVTYQGKPLTVLPAETIQVVSSAFSRIGKSFAAGTAGPETYDCAGLTRSVWAGVGIDLAADPVGQWTQSTVVGKDTRQVGDAVFLADPQAGIHHVGIYLGGDLMIAASGSSHAVLVERLGPDLHGAARLTLPRPAAPNGAPAVSPDALPWKCGGINSGTATTSAWVSPIEEGKFSPGPAFGATGAQWAGGYHQGQDFIAPAGTPVRAATSGIVSTESQPWAGTLVRIDHGSGMQSTYAHMSKVIAQPGTRVKPGQVIGLVGAAGQAPQPHLHFEVWVGGKPVDPMPYLTGGSVGWGGHRNGMIPAEALCPLPNPGHALRCDAARAYAMMAAAYQAETGSPLCLTDTYRSFPAQVDVYARKPGLAARPGTSNHGWGLAIDLCGGIETFGTPAHAWMQANAGRFGWVHPRWAQAGGSKPEPWHWEWL